MQDMTNLNVNINMENLKTLDELKKFKAKGKPENISIVEHTKAVLKMGMLASDKHYMNWDYKKVYRNELAATLILHDIGKFSESFQNYIEHGNEKEYKIKHNVLSWAFVSDYIINNTDPTVGIRVNLDNICDNVFFHHYTDVNDEIDNTKISKNTEDYINMCSFFIGMCDYCDKNYDTTLSDIFTIGDNESSEKKFPSGMSVIDFKNRWDDNPVLRDFELCKRMMVRSILQNSDRRASELGNIVNNDDYVINDSVVIINEEFPKFNDLKLYEVYDDGERLEQQLDIVNRMIDKESTINTHIVTASAGFGKTLTGLIWVYKTRQKVFWVVPRQEIADNTYASILKDLTKINCVDKMKVSLFYGGEIKDCNFQDKKVKDVIDESDIIVTIIDNVFNFNFKNNLSDKLYEFYNRNIIFDEFHEFAAHNNAPLFSEFILTMKIRALRVKAQTLLLSATPINIDELVGLNNNKFFKNVEYYTPIIYGGSTKYNFQFIKLKDVKDYVNNNMAFINPTVKSCQKIYKEIKIYAKDKTELNEPEIFHASFIDEDRKQKANEIISMFGKQSNKNKCFVSATSILSTGIDVSFQNMILFVWKPSDFIQSLGRVNRFCEYKDDEVNIYIIDPTDEDNNIKFKGFLSKCVFDNTLANKWIKTLKDYVENKSQPTKNEVYELYNEFIKNNVGKFNEYYSNMYNNSLKISKNIRLKKGSNVEMLEKGNMILSSQTNHRGVSNSVYCAIPSTDDNVEYVTMQIDVMYLPEDYDDDLKKRFEFMKNHCSKNDDEIDYSKKEKKLLKENSKSKLVSTNDEIIKMARDKKTPLYLPQCTYSSEIGKEVKTDDEDFDI